MKTSLKLIKFLLLIAVLLLILPAHEIARADISPEPASGFGGLQPFQDQATEVQMVYERVEMELKNEPPPEADPDRPYYSVDVVAWFVMHNQGQKEEAIQVIFPVNDLNDCLKLNDVSAPASFTHYLMTDFSVNVDGVPITSTQIQTEHPYKDMSERCDYTGMNWEEFPVTFPAGKDTLIRVQYTLQGELLDEINNIQYTLETGAAWKGPIGTAYIVFRFPYLPTNDAILSATTPGYQTLQNEIFWTYNNLEPTRANNITISIVEPDIWHRILGVRQKIQQDRNDITAWLELAGLYSGVAYGPKNDIRDEDYRQKAINTYQQAIAVNPNSAELYAAYADLLGYECCYNVFYTQEDANRILPLVDKALKLDPANEVALTVLMGMENNIEGFTYDRPVTFTPSITPTLAVTQTSATTPMLIVTQTPTITRTPRPPTPTPTQTRAPTLPATYTPISSPTKPPAASKSPSATIEIKESPTATITRPAAMDTPVPPPVKKKGVQVPAIAIIFILAAFAVIPVISFFIGKRNR